MQLRSVSGREKGVACIKTPSTSFLILLYSAVCKPTTKHSSEGYLYFVISSDICVSPSFGTAETHRRPTFTLFISLPKSDNKLRTYVCALCAVANNARCLCLSNTTEHRSIEVTVVNVVKISLYVSWEPKVYYHIQKIPPASSVPYFEPNKLVCTLILFVRDFVSYCRFICALS